MENISEFYDSAQRALDSFGKSIQCYKIERHAKADHLCYKCASSESFEKIRAILENESVFVYQSIIADRRIAVIKLKKSLTSIIGNIDVIELSDQKPDKSQKEGYDHVEVYPVNFGYEQLVSELKNKGVEIKEVVRPHHTTHDIKTESGLLLRLEREPLMDKIIREEMKL